MSSVATFRSPNALKFDHTPEEIKRRAASVISSSTEVLDDVVNLKSSRTFQNSIIPIVKFEAEMSTICANLTFYRYVSTCKDVRAQSLAAEEKFDEFDI